MSRLSGLEKLAYKANLMPVWADEILRERRGSLSASAIRDLTLLATDSAEAAEDAYVAKVEDDLRNDKKPE